MKRAGLIPDSVGPETLARYFDVSRESLEKLEIYVAELLRWQKRINLIASSTISTVWHRHVCDGLQLADFIENTDDSIVDLGAGCGIPGIPVAIAMQDRGGPPPLVMIESNARKCAFLRHVSALCEINTRIINARVESVNDSALQRSLDIVIARGLAPLAELLELVEKLPRHPQRMLFLKGQDVDVELTEATKCWNIAFRIHQSRTRTNGCVLEIYEARRVRRSNST
jgi:16S rRNA (guanine527-N7)-methyltransferase